VSLPFRHRSGGRPGRANLGLKNRVTSGTVQFMATEESRLSLAPGPAGWVEVTLPDSSPVYVRFALKPDRKTWRLDRLLLVDPTGDALRGFPLSRVEAAANANALVALGLAVGRNQDDPTDVPGWFRKYRARAKTMEAAGRYLLERPKSRRLDDAFYARVAEAYRGAVAQGLNPRQTLARDSGAAPDTVARWVGEARRRHFLPKGQPGKITVDSPKEDQAK
jgi:hypothetical protein